MSKYKVGDRVRIKTREELILDKGVVYNSLQKSYNGPRDVINKKMQKYLGKVVTIRSAPGAYMIEGDPNSWYDWMISGIAHEVGDRVRIKKWSELQDDPEVLKDRDYWYAIKSVAGEEVTLNESYYVILSGETKFSTRPSPISQRGIQYAIYPYMIDYNITQKEDEEMETQEGWYFSTLDMQLGHGDNRKITPGKSHSVKGRIEVCRNGLHLFPTLKNVSPGIPLKFVDLRSHVPQNIRSTKKLILWRVEGSGERDPESPKVAYRNRKYLWGVHVQGWELEDYEKIDQFRSVDEVNHYLKYISRDADKIADNKVVYYEPSIQVTETVEVPHFEGYKALGCMEATEGLYRLTPHGNLEKIINDSEFIRLTYEKLTPPFPEVKMGQVWEVDGKLVLVCKPNNQFTLMTLNSEFPGNDTYHHLNSSECNPKGARKYFEKEEARLLADSVEDYYSA